MRVHDRAVPAEASEALNTRVEGDVHHALNAVATDDGKFVVNDTLWFMRRGNGGVSPCVMNSAKYITSNFQDALRDERDWEKEKPLAGQTIDNYLAVETTEARYRILTNEDFLEFFNRLCENDMPADLLKEFRSAWHQYFRIGVPDLSDLDESVKHMFQLDEGPRTIRIGLEFETGNIASAFRALTKLESLFQLDEIDFGVFVTSIDKANASARIWPASNRNGSFVELENRNYRSNVSVPLWEFGFEPDEFDQHAPYFNNRELYVPTETQETETDGETHYQVCMRGNERILRPIPPEADSSPGD